MVASRAIEMFGSDEANERYLRPVIAVEDRVAIGISEPKAGSDIAPMRTTVEVRDDDLVLNGEKIWVSNVEHSSVVLV